MCNNFTLEDLQDLFTNWLCESDFAISIWWEIFSQKGGCAYD